MDLLKDRIKPVYYRYFLAAFGSSLISSIYGMVDMAMVGQYQGPEGSAAMAVISPIWNIIYSLGLLMGIGGSVLFGSIRGKASGKSGDQGREADQYFGAATIGTALLSGILWMFLLFFDTPLLQLFGANETLQPLAKRYLFPIKFGVPFFLFGQLLASFLRNDNHPALATKAVICGGVLNIFGEYFFVFTLNMGIMGAGLATLLCNIMSVLVMLTHFKGKNNTLKMVSVSTLVQCCAYSIGQAAQPIISMNYGAKQMGRVREVFRYASVTAVVFGVLWTLFCMAVPNGLVRVFMTPTPGVLAIAPEIIRRYCISFLLLPFNVFLTFYFQAILKPKLSFVISLARGALISGCLILLLPAVAGGDAIWFTMPLTEAVVFALAAGLSRKDRL